MGAISIVFLILELIIIGVGILISCKRGFGRATVRLAYLAVIGVASFFIARAMASAFSEPLYNFISRLVSTGDVQKLLEHTPDIELLIQNIIGSLVTPFIFSALFLILQLLSLILFGKVSRKIVSSITKNSGSPSAKSKCFGACIGLISYVAVAAIILSPLYMAVKITDNFSVDTVYVNSEKVVQNVSPKPKTELKRSGVTTTSTTKFHPLSNLILNQTTQFTIPGTTQNETISEFSAVIFNLIDDIVYVQNQVVNNGGTNLDLLGNSMAAVIPHLDDSITLKYAVTNVLRTFGDILREEWQFMGIALPDDNGIITESIVNSILNTMSNTTLDTVKDDMAMLFGTLDDELSLKSKGVIIAFIEIQNNYGNDTQTMLQEALKLFKDDPKISSMINEALSKYIVSVLPDDVDIKSDTIKEILDNNDIDFSDVDVDNITKDDIKNIVESNDVQIDDATLEIIRNYLGDDTITKEDVDNYINDIESGGASESGTAGGDINIDLSDVDVNSLTPEQIDELRKIYGDDAVDNFLNK